MAKVVNIPSFQLSDSTHIPAIGLGTYTKDVSAFSKALEVGYRHFDTASAYMSEEGLGQALKEAIAQGLVKREDVFLTTKLWATHVDVPDILPALKESLGKLQVDYVDLYLIHWPFRLKPNAKFASTNKEDYLPLDLKATWQEMEKLVQLGLTKSIGVSNFYVKVLQQLLSTAKIPPAVNQVELHPQWQQEKVRAYCKKKGIHVTTWSPIGSPGSINSKGLYDINHPVIKQLAEKYGKSGAQVGYRHFDTASTYGSEEGLGEALKEAIAQGLIKREDVFLTTKIPPTRLDIPDILPSLKESLGKLQVDYVDLYLIHWPYRLKQGANFNSTNKEDYPPWDLKATWQEMEKLVNLDLTKSIGVSNFYVKVLQQLLSIAKIPPAVNQIELHPQWQQEKVRAYCKKKGVHVTAWSPIAAPGSLFSGALVGINHPVIKEIAEKYGKSGAQIALRWEYELGISTVPKSYNEVRMTQNLSVWDFSLTDEDHEKVKTIEQVTVMDSEFFQNFKGSPWRSVSEFWDNEEVDSI